MKDLCFITALLWEDRDAADSVRSNYLLCKIYSSLDTGMELLISLTSHYDTHHLSCRPFGHAHISVTTAFQGVSILPVLT